MVSAVGSLEALRESNRSRVLRVLQERGTASRAEIVTLTGLSRSAVSNLVGELLQTGEVIEHPVMPGAELRPGRPTRPLSLDPTSGAFLGVRLSHFDARLVLLDRAGAVVASALDPIDQQWAPERIADHIHGTARRLLVEAHVAPEKLLAAGLAVSTPLQSHGGEVTGVLGPTTGAVAGALSSGLGVSVQVENDANLGGLAEARLGAGSESEHMLYVMLSAGVGGAVYLGGALYEGAHRTAGELGHAPAVARDGRRCRCGNKGCLETVGGIAGLLAAAAEAGVAVTDLPELVGRVTSGEPAAVAVVAAAGAAVGRALAPLCLVLDPGLVVIGGEVAELGSPLFDSLTDALATALPAHARGAYEVRPGSLGVYAEALGAAAWVMGRTSITQAG